MTGKTILITGASSGIGAAIARVLIAQGRGHRLVLTARRVELLAALANDAERHGCTCLVISEDLVDPDAPSRILDSTIARYGGLDILINNAGYGLPRMFAASEVEAIVDQIQVNLTAPLVLTRLALKHLIEAKGTVINIGSSITCVANPIFGAYGSTKAGLAYWNDALRRELMPRGVKVCLVEPGPVGTEFFQAIVGRDGRSHEHVTDATYQELTAIAPPPSWISATSDDVARRVVRLIDHPRRRISVLRRTVWPFRLIGALITALPILGDLVISRIVARNQKEADVREVG